VAEMMTRVQWKAGGDEGKYAGFHSVLSVLSYMLKVCCVPNLILLNDG
jgi:myo-inositol-1-phosphate synthase